MATRQEPPGPEQGDLREWPLSELLKQLSEETTRLVHQEIELAKAELTQKGKQAGMGAGMFGGAGVVGFLALAALTTCFILALDIVLPAWLAALIVAVVYGAIAAVLVLRGRDKIKQAAPPVPEQTIETVREDVQWAKTQMPSSKKASRPGRR
jgi:Putative Actinobacterial Holin-X, holin superfamily III